MTSKYIIFLSDLHLSDSYKVATEAWTHFIEHTAKKAEALYILGDFFDVWIGDDEQTPFQEHIQSQLKKCSQYTTPIYFMVGNRDFLIGKTFSEKTGVSLIPDSTSITYGNNTLLLSHGDRLCSEDYTHQLARVILQNRVTKKLIYSLPLKLRKKIAFSLRKHSQKKTQKISHPIMDVTERALARLLGKYPCDYLIHGHTHKPNEHPLLSHTQTKARIVLGAWETQQARYLRFYLDGSYTWHCAINDREIDNLHRVSED